jgi:hypothetical protein
MRRSNFVLTIAAASVIVVVLATGIAVALAHGSTTSNPHRDPLQAVRAATARYHSLTVAQANGYALLKDTAGIACIDNPGVGAMGVHYANGDLVKAGQINPNTPQALVYEPAENGQLRLVAVEYVVIKQQWDAANPSAPMLFGQHFMLTPDGNRFGLPAFYSLHAWIWQSNPVGMFSMWNPTVSCNAASTRSSSHTAALIPANSDDRSLPHGRGPR